MNEFESPSADRTRPPRIILGSASPRRRELLGEAGVEFAIDRPDVDESLAEGISPEAAACELAERKARAVAARHTNDDAIVLAADTIVALELPAAPGLPPRVVLLGKPADEREAAEMLGSLSSSRHCVVTGVSAIHTRHGVAHTACERTWVTMRAISPSEIQAYVESGEWRDKAGGYAIQETADQFVTKLEEGGLDNVVGLPVQLSLALLERARSLAGPSATG